MHGIINSDLVHQLVHETEHLYYLFHSSSNGDHATLPPGGSSANVQVNAQQYNNNFPN